MPPLPKIAPIRLIERAVAYLEKGSAKLVSRKGITYVRFDELCAGIANAMKAKDAIIDGGEFLLLADDALKQPRGAQAQSPHPRSALFTA